MHRHIMDLYLGIKNNGILPFAATYTELEDIVLYGISQTQKDKYPLIPHILPSTMTKAKKSISEM